MLQKEKRAKPKAPRGSAFQKVVRERKAKVAYRLYSEKALLRFDLEGTTETIRQHREQMALYHAIGQYVMSDRIRDILEQEKAHQIALATALGDGAPGRID